MATEIINQGTLETVTTGAVNVSVIVMIIVFAIAMIVGIILFINYTRKWKQFTVIVWSFDAFGQVVETIDTAGVFVDKATNAKRFYMKRAKSSLPADTIPIIYRGKKKIVYVRQVGLKNFDYLKPEVTLNEIKLHTVTEQDVNWAINDFDKQTKAFAKNNWLAYLPFIALGIVAIVILVIFVYFFKKLDVLQEFGAQLVEAARILNPSVIQ